LRQQRQIRTLIGGDTVVTDGLTPWLNSRRLQVPKMAGGFRG